MEEEQLLARVRAGDHNALNDLLERYQERVYRLAFRMLGNEEDAKDAVQDILLRLSNSITNFRGTSKFSTWTYRVAYNTCVDFQRRRKPWSNVIPFEGLSEQTAGLVPFGSTINSDPDVLCEERFREKLLNQALASLSESQRAVLWLRDWEGLSNKEVATVFGVSEGTLKARLHRARGALRRTLEEGVAVAGHEQAGRFYVTATGQIE